MATDVFRSLRGRYPGWQCWRGVSGLLYARTTHKRPPVVVRAYSPSDLADQIELAEEPNGEVSQKSEGDGVVVSFPVHERPPHELRDGGHSYWYDRP